MPARRFRLDRPLIAAGHDVVMAAISYVLSLYLRLGMADFWSQVHGFVIEGTVVFTVVAAIVFWLMRLYRGVWRYASLNDLIAIAKATSVAILVFLAAMFLLTRLDAMPRSALAINWLVLLVLLGGPRLFYRLAKDRALIGLADRGYDARVPVLLVGAGDAAEQFLRQMRRPGERYRVVGLVDDDPARIGRHIHGVPVLGSVASIPEAVARLRRQGRRPRRLLVTDERLGAPALGEMLAVADAHGMTLARLPRLTDFESSAPGQVRVRPIALEDLLGRPQTRLDRAAMAHLIEDRRVLVTGAGGTIGGELVRQIAGYRPRRLVLLDSSEHNLYQIDRAIDESSPSLARTVVIADVRDRAALGQVFESERPELVAHAAALKHVPLSEHNPCETVLTNVNGTRNVADISRAVGATAMVQISTDKAVNPTSVMGATKRLAESYCQALDRAAGAAGAGTRFVTVRFGNVLGSTGSVVPLFQHQLAHGGPLTVTHPEVTRYFMTASEAVELVLQASALALGSDGAGSVPAQGRIFVLDMGRPVRIQDLARQMIRLAGLRPDHDIAIAYGGLRPGEKLHEELFHEGEPLIPTGHESIRLANPRAADLDQLSRRLDELAAHAVARRTDAVLALLHALVPEYRAPDAERAIAQ